MADTVRAHHGMECPGCGRDQDIRIWANREVEIMLFPDGTDDADLGYLSWDDDNACRCTDCGHHGCVGDFRVKTVEQKAEEERAQWREEVHYGNTILGYYAWVADQEGENPVQTPETPANSHSDGPEPYSTWFIRGPGGTYWSTDQGWVSQFSDATMFPREAVQELNKEGADFPTGGTWVQHAMAVRANSHGQD